MKNHRTWHDMAYITNIFYKKWQSRSHGRDTLQLCRPGVITMVSPPQKYLFKSNHGFKMFQAPWIFEEMVSLMFEEKIEFTENKQWILEVLKQWT
jgi:hypothetical protein